jgi:flagellar hook assembly protein FlgD
VVYNILGQQIRTLSQVQQVAGTDEIAWDGRDEYGNAVSSGVYIYQLRAGEYLQSRKMLLTR